MVSNQGASGGADLQVTQIVELGQGYGSGECWGRQPLESRFLVKRGGSHSATQRQPVIAMRDFRSNVVIL